MPKVDSFLAGIKSELSLEQEQHKVQKITCDIPLENLKCGSMCCKNLNALFTHELRLRGKMAKRPYKYYARGSRPSSVVPKVDSFLAGIKSELSLEQEQHKVQKITCDIPLENLKCGSMCCKNLNALFTHELRLKGKMAKRPYKYYARGSRPIGKFLALSKRLRSA